jgi:type II secretory pathway component PulF
MATVFEVKVRDKRGKTFFKTVKGDNPNAVKQDLKNRNFTVMGIREKGAGGLGARCLPSTWTPSKISWNAASS